VLLVESAALGQFLFERMYLSSHKICLLLNQAKLICQIVNGCLQGPVLGFSLDFSLVAFL
jgi:hypothetical protein